MDKSDLRQEFCYLRECLPIEDVAAASTALCHRLAAWLRRYYQQTHRPARKQADQLTNHILTYLAFRNEPDLSLLFDLLPHIHWVIPRIVKGRRLSIHPYNPTSLVRHRFGMLEPTPDSPLVDPLVLDIVLVPGVAFDPHGGRLGFGGGYYDRFLSTTPALRVGVTFDTCLADEIPCSEHDQRMDWVMTPTREVFCTPSWNAERAPHIDPTR
jgi:5-formyltetrahydrofolate cyclo-ligase